MSQAPQDTLKTLRKLWFIFVQSHPIFVFVLFYAAMPEDTPQELEVGIVAVFSIASIVSAVLSLMARRFMMGRLSESASDAKIASTYQTGSIMSWVFAEVVSFSGFALGFVSMNPKISIPFVIVGLVCHVLALPREADLASRSSAPSAPTGDSW